MAAVTAETQRRDAAEQRAADLSGQLATSCARFASRQPGRPTPRTRAESVFHPDNDTGSLPAAPDTRIPAKNSP
jgi:hypothetical protein